MTIFQGDTRLARKYVSEKLLNANARLKIVCEIACVSTTWLPKSQLPAFFARTETVTSADLLDFKCGAA